jgi:hypothetical protein
MHLRSSLTSCIAIKLELVALISYGLPCSHFSPLGLNHPKDFITVQQAQRIECPLHLSHGIHRWLPEFMWEIVTLDHTNTMFTCHSPFHLNCSLHHSVDDSFREFSFIIIVENCN